MRHRVFLLLGCLACSLLSACGTTYPVGFQGVSVTAGSTMTPDATTVVASTVTPASTITPGSTATPGTFPPATTTPGTFTPVPTTAVMLTLNQTALQSRSIAATIHNGSPDMISAADHLSNCTLVTLQQSTPGTGNWSDIAPCKTATATRLIEIAAGASMAVDLGTGAQGTTWGPGTYRLVLHYARVTKSGVDAFYDTYSATFTLS